MMIMKNMKYSQWVRIMKKNTKYSRWVVGEDMKKNMKYSRWVGEDNDEEHEVLTMGW